MSTLSQPGVWINNNLESRHGVDTRVVDISLGPSEIMHCTLRAGYAYCIMRRLTDLNKDQISSEICAFAISKASNAKSGLIKPGLESCFFQISRTWNFSLLFQILLPPFFALHSNLGLHDLQHHQTTLIAKFES
jgi:hypothetical protein